MLSVIFGLIGVIVGVLWLASWNAWDEFLVVLQGSLPPFLILVGLVAIAAGISSIKDNMAAKKEEEKMEKEEESTEEASSEEEGPEEEEEEKPTE